jgi:hypothetical protein
MNANGITAVLQEVGISDKCPLRRHLERSAAESKSLSQGSNRSHRSITHKLSVRGIASVAVRMDCNEHILRTDKTQR